ncbi:hypothetical protein DFH06DRAFT_1475230 [Mycena polygramma]|nr:hypothetical protein DFH06DRAFT_1477580 [Mycena polygramma]KAJ7652383.1 hypothetical protein DFH06DRAFT_1475230 [Mycena polygramma]
MADTTRPDVRSSSTSIMGNPEIISSGLFSGAQNFVATGHTFQNITYAAPAEPSDFRTFPLGDIDLQREICLDNDTGVVWRRGGSNRRLYSARIGERSVTVAMYQGDGADEEWREYMAKHTSLRHPNIIQIYGVASSGGIHATLFHGDLIPFEHWLDPYKSSPCVTIYMYAYYGREFDEADNYLHQFGRGSTMSHECTMWIRLSTGRLCVDRMPPHKPIMLLYFSKLPISGSGATVFLSRDTPMIEALAIDTLTLDQYHEVCCRTLAHNSRIDIPTGITASLGKVALRPLNSPDLFGIVIASLPEEDTEFRWYNSGPGEGEIMENGWTRFNTRDVSGGALDLHYWSGGAASWLSQSNYIFKRCEITSNFNDYVFVDSIRFQISVTANGILTGFLFLCPENDFWTGPSSVHWPTCPAYWSFEPSGAHPLSTEEAMELGFPTLQFSTELAGSRWDSSVYAGLAKFYLAKGFDPYSQDVARHLGLPLFQLSVPIDPVFAHIVEEQDDSEEDSGSEMDIDNDDAENQDDDLSEMELD